MTEGSGFLRGLNGRARAGLAVGVLVVLLGTAAVGWWLMRTEYQVLFSDLKPQDAQAMTAELERLKVPYKLGDAGSAILVDAHAVHATRIKLLGRDVPLHGSVGLELFNNTDFGMTEFAQKVNFQRALQGELTRTIKSLIEINDVRVLLAMPEQGLFKQATAKPKASITLSLKPGRTLRGEQIVGIQRLVAAAVPGMAIQDVTLVDESGVALTRADAGDGEAPAGARLDLKREMEAYLQRKLAEMLDRAVGAGQAMASVDVTLSMDQVRTTTEDVLPAAGRTGLQSTGVVVRDKEVFRDAAGSERRGADTGTRGGGSQRDTEYAVGRRVEQVVGQPGAVRRLHVVAVLRQALDPAQTEKLRAVLAAAVGADAERGDTVVVQSLVAAASSLAAQQVASAALAASTPASAESAAAPDAVRPSVGEALAAALLILLALVGVAVWSRRAAARKDLGGNAGRRLTVAERNAALARVQAWLAADGLHSAGAPGAGSTPGRGPNA
ncbi:MAG: flagellar basal-body MS-ring/collar protein FliF [Bordetella sp.]|nr:flagellar basal-body MS-ring/collar protein FliF [Bordetella sp.]